MKIMTDGMELTFAGTGVGETETRWEQRGGGNEICRNGWV